jgi:cell division protein ZapA (FtsZ GTPase activity inhibitor)
MLNAQTVQIDLMGQKISVRATEADPAFVQEVVDLVTSKVEGAEKRVKGSSHNQVLLLALLDMAEEYLKAKQRTFEFHAQMDEKSRKLMDLIGSDVDNPTPTEQ